MKTYLYDFAPHSPAPASVKPHFHIVKLGFTGVYIIFFLFLLKNMDVEAVLTSTNNLCFEQTYEKKNQNFYLKTFSFFGGEIFSKFVWACSRNALLDCVGI